MFVPSFISFQASLALQDPQPRAKQSTVPFSNKPESRNGQQTLIRGPQRPAGNVGLQQLSNVSRLKMQGSVCDDKNLELNSEFDWEPVKTNQDCCHVRPFRGLGQKYSRSILDHLKTIQGCFAEASEEGVTIVKTG